MVRRVDGRLSDRANACWPGAVVLCEQLRSGVELPEERFNEVRWILERPGAEPVELGSHFHASVRALGALIRAEKARRITA